MRHYHFMYCFFYVLGSHCVWQSIERIGSELYYPRFVFVVYFDYICCCMTSTSRIGAKCSTLDLVWNCYTDGLIAWPKNNTLVLASWFMVMEFCYLHWILQHCIRPYTPTKTHLDTPPPIRGLLSNLRIN